MNSNRQQNKPSIMTSLFNLVFVAFKLLLRSSNHNRKSLSDYILCIAAIAVSMMMLILASAVANGFSDAMKMGLTAFSGHGSIRKFWKSNLDKSDEIRNVLSSKKSIVAFTPYLIADAIVENKNRFEYSKTIGVDIGDYFRLTDFQKYLVKGTPGTISDSGISVNGRHLPSLLIGNGLAKSLKVDVGDEVVLAALNKLDENSRIPMMIRFVVSGIYKVSIYEYDYTTCVVPISNAQELFGLQNPEGFWIRVDDIRNTKSILENVQQQLGGFPYYASDYKENNASLFRWIEFQNRISILALSLIFFTAIGTSLTLLLTISLERWSELGVLRCLGASRGYLFKINTIQGIIIGVIGSLIGILLGFLTCWVINRFSLIRLPEEVYIVNILHVQMDMWETVILGILAVIAPAVTSCVPALLSLRINPIDLFRNSR